MKTAGLEMDRNDVIWVCIKAICFSKTRFHSIDLMFQYTFSQVTSQSHCKHVSLDLQNAKISDHKQYNQLAVYAFQH